MRSLSLSFLQDLLDGKLAPLLARVKEDDSLDLQIRENYVNVYFRGGNLLCVKQVGEHVYSFEFDQKYGDLPDRPRIVVVPPQLLVSSAEQCSGWLENTPLLKDLMARWFTAHPKRERDVQQVFTRENTWDPAVAGGTDYFVCDIEYARGDARFDAIAVRWPSSATERKRKTGHRLAFVELKYGDGALAGTSGIVEHTAQVDRLCGDAAALMDLKKEMLGLFQQKHALGLIGNQHSLESFGDEVPQLILLVANHDPASAILARELERITANPPIHVEVLVASASDFGYGLYEDRCVSVPSYLARWARGGRP